MTKRFPKKMATAQSAASAKKIARERRRLATQMPEYLLEKHPELGE
jgi:hypothetical protein